MAHNDIKEAKSTYESFISMSKIGMVIVALVTVLVVLLIS